MFLISVKEIWLVTTKNLGLDVKYTVLYLFISVL